MLLSHRRRSPGYGGILGQVIVACHQSLANSSVGVSVLRPPLNLILHAQLSHLMKSSVCKIDETDLQACISAAPPVTSRGHNLRLKCFQKWIGQGNGVYIGPMLLELQDKLYCSDSSKMPTGGYEDDEDHGERFLYRGKYVLIIPS
ncbi:hypothetical protein R3W88_010055 [Solanum pinnatisectum]|uniref:Uncharacterized protein n=1 Tax=Solanum pinnatisectum TaxID=50273 RepID=A0AAV9MFG4_9SOLN|nr:hypothetical protein R3W88_010055 [Solanum pinnatisectum]